MRGIEEHRAAVPVPPQPLCCPPSRPRSGVVGEFGAVLSAFLGRTPPRTLHHTAHRPPLAEPPAFVLAKAMK